MYILEYICVYMRVKQSCYSNSEEQKKKRLHPTSLESEKQIEMGKEILEDCEITRTETELSHTANPTTQTTLIFSLSLCVAVCLSLSSLHLNGTASMQAERK